MRVVFLFLSLLLISSAPRFAWALPSFAEQTGQPCAACHVGAFGPQLKPIGRDFKLYGYTATDGKPHGPPIAMTIQGSFTHTNTSQSPPPRWFAPNNNVALGETSVYLAGRLAPKVGTFTELNYDGVTRVVSLKNADVRFATDAELWGNDLVWGITVNNAPTVQDLWNSTPIWGFPYNSSALAPTPAAATLIDGRLAQVVAGGGAYALWNDLIYFETSLYGGLSRNTRNALGAVPVAGTDTIVGAVPYWRLALQKNFDDDHNYVEIGTYGMFASLYPGGDTLLPGKDSFTDIAFDMNYQWIADQKSVVSNVVSAHATWIHEKQLLSGSNLLTDANRHGNLNTGRADVSYSIGATWTPSIQYFQTAGSPNPLYYGTPAGVPNSAGIITEIAYVPWGKPDSPWPWINVRLAAQYIAYTQYNGSSRHASDNNTLFLSIWTAWRF